MSHITCKVQAYDCLDTVQLTISITDWDVPAESENHQTYISTTLEGQGISDHTEWVRDVLVGALEAL